MSAIKSIVMLHYEQILCLGLDNCPPHPLDFLLYPKGNPFSWVRNVIRYVFLSLGYCVCLTVFKLMQKAFQSKIQYFFCV